LGASLGIQEVVADGREDLLAESGEAGRQAGRDGKDPKDCKDSKDVKSFGP
jgi:hypothetical protein